MQDVQCSQVVRADQAHGPLPLLWRLVEMSRLYCVEFSGDGDVVRASSGGMARVGHEPPVELGHSGREPYHNISTDNSVESSGKTCRAGSCSCRVGPASTVQAYEWRIEEKPEPYRRYAGTRTKVVAPTLFLKLIGEGSKLYKL